MRIVDMLVMRGPNYWSVSQPKLIVMTLALEETILDAAAVRAFTSHLNSHFPSIPCYVCDDDARAPFAFTSAIGRLASSLQLKSGINSLHIGTQEIEHGRYRVIFSYETPNAGREAAAVALEIGQSFFDHQLPDIVSHITKVRHAHNFEKLGPSTSAIVEEALQRDIPVIRLDDGSLVQLGYGINQKRIEATIACTTSNIAVDIAGDKEVTKKLLYRAEVPVPKGVIVNSVEELTDAVEEVGYPLVIKPVDGNHGNGATTNICSMLEAKAAFENASAFSNRIICERFITGFDFRILIINYKFVAAARRTPAAIVGDGIHTIQELIDKENEDPKRGEGHENILTKISIDAVTENILSSKGYTLQTVLTEGDELWLKPTANLSTGGTATDITDLVHPQNIALFERIARVIGLDICGIDVIAINLSEPIINTGGVVLEVNAAPGFRMHLQPSIGSPRNVAKPVIDMLFPNNKNGRIPIVAITGTNGKTTTTRLIAHIGKTVGNKVGYTTTDGIYIDDILITKGDCAGPASAELILKDPSVELAVLECARGGMLRSGLAFNYCDVAVVTNVAEDHLGLNGINTLEELARVKSVLPQTVHKEGYAVLNADDDLVYAMKDKLQCNVALFSLSDKNVRIKAHIQNGGIAAVCEHGFITIWHGNKRIRVEKLLKIPITFGGKAEFNIANALAATVASYTRNIRIEDIRKGLQTFVPSSETTPGRMNVFDFKEFTIMLDYAHNPHGLRAIGKYVQSVEATLKVGVIAGVGDRRDEDLISLGEEASLIFDEIIIRLDKDLRGRTANEITSLVSRGIKQQDALKKILLFETEREAIDFILNNYTPGSFVVVLSDTVTESIEQIKEAKSKKDGNAVLPYVQSLTA